MDLSITPKLQPRSKSAALTVGPTETAPQVPASEQPINDTKRPDHARTLVKNVPEPALVDNSGTAILPLASKEATVDAEQNIPRSLAEASLRERPKCRSPAKKAKAPKDPKEPQQAKRSRKRKEPKESEERQQNEASGSTKKREEKEQPCAKERPEGMPNYRGFPTADLNKLVSSYGFKAIKRRDDQIKLLEQCWESKNRTVLQSLEPEPSFPQPVQMVQEVEELPKHSSPVKKRGRPAKPATSATSKGNEHLPDDKDATPKPRGRPPKAKVLDTPEDAVGVGKGDLTPKKKPRSKKATTSNTSPDTTPKSSIPAKRKATPPPAEPLGNSDTTPKPHAASLAITPDLDLTPSHDTTLPLLDRSTLLEKITEAITTYPPSHEMKCLTWNEKILLYDPIVLEDLTTWLNLEGLGRVGVDEEVGVGMVKEWCEAKSVCCLWRENLRGGVRSRY